MAQPWKAPNLSPANAFISRLSDASILVDINDYALAISLSPSYLPPDYLPPPDVVEQLLSQGIHPEDITHLLITHAHFDHYIRLGSRKNCDRI